MVRTAAGVPTGPENRPPCEGRVGSSPTLTVTWERGNDGVLLWSVKPVRFGAWGFDSLRSHGQVECPANCRASGRMRLVGVAVCISHCHCEGDGFDSRTGRSWGTVAEW
jgi:hypothetical protein